MMTSCCGIDFCSQFDCKVKETDKGVQVDIKPKDDSKVESLKALAKACRDFCGCD